MTAAATPKFDADYESPHSREVRECEREIAYYLTRGGDPTRLGADRAEFHRRANVARARLRDLQSRELERLAALAEADGFEYDEDDDTPAKEPA